MEHLPGLLKYVEPEDLVLFARDPIQEKTEVAVRGYLERRLAISEAVSFAMVIQATSEAVGHTSFMSIREPDRVVEIGATWIGRQFQGTAVNPEVKFLMLKHAFEDLGCVRVELVTDARNHRSQAAIAKLGATREGVLRKHKITYSGFVRNTVMFSILDDEWAKVKAGLIDRLGYDPSHRGN